MNRWNGHLAGLLKFREENGHCNVPQEYPPNPALASFVHHIRKQKDLSVERRKTLLDLGFIFNAHKAGWDEKFYEAKRILDEKRVSGEKIVVKRKDNALLYKWIGTQREEYAKLRRGEKSSMTEDKIFRLERIGVNLDPTGKFAERGGGGGRMNRKKKVCIHFFLSFADVFLSIECKYVCPCLSILYIYMYIYILFYITSQQKYICGCGCACST